MLQLNDIEEKEELEELEEGKMETLSDQLPTPTLTKAQVKRYAVDFTTCTIYTNALAVPSMLLELCTYRTVVLNQLSVTCHQYHDNHMKSRLKQLSSLFIIFHLTAGYLSI